MPLQKVRLPTMTTMNSEVTSDIHGLLFPSYIKPHTQLKPYKYAPGGGTRLDKTMNLWWELFVKVVPTWVAPNTITMCSFWCGIIPFLMLFYYSPTLREPFPKWGCLAAALFHFAYQTLDAIDGKHARRTNTASSLGQIFDHGCDIIASTMIVATVVGVVGCGVGKLPFLTIFVSAQLHQFMYMWAEYHTHVFYCAFGNVGVTEAQIGCILVCMFASIADPSAFSLSLTEYFPFLFRLSGGMEIQLRDVIQLALCVQNLKNAVKFIYSKGYRELPGEAYALATGHLIAFLAFGVAEATLYHYCLIVMEMSPLICYVAFTSAYSILLIRLLISSCCGMHFKVIQWPVVPFIVTGVIFAQFHNTPEYFTVLRWTLGAVTIFQLAYLTDLLITSIRTIKKSLDIRCFHNAPKTHTEKSS